VNLEIETAIHLLHQSEHACLATNGLRVPGYPFLSALPVALDERHCPVLLISNLAEHTRNITADGRVSLLFLELGHSDIQAGARLTLLGNAEPFTPEPAMIERYLRYVPSANRLLALADFHFFRIQPMRIRLIEGFGRMGWLDESALATTTTLSLEREAALLATIAAALPATQQVLGLDRYGVDILGGRIRRRARFPGAPVSDGDVERMAPEAVRPMP
jgi:putative heme iron utilization protein